MRIRNFVWDFDGMLFDTYPHTCAAFETVLRRHGVTPDRDELYATMKITLWDAFKAYGADAAFIEEFYALENTLDFEPVGKPFPGIPALLQSIASRGGRNFLYTHRDKVAYAYFERYGLSPLFSGGITAEDGFPHKPAPDALLSLCADHGLPPAETMMFGDRLIDIGAGRNAGLFTCLFDTDRVFSPDDADRYCTDVPGLAAIVETLLPS